MAIRYDKSRVIFRAADNRTDFDVESTSKLKSLEEPVAKLGGGSTWEPSAELLNAHQELFYRAHAGEQWQLEVSADSRIAVVVEKPVVVSVGCFAFAGFLAEVVGPAQADFAASPKQYFLIRKDPPAHAGPAQKATQIGALPDWKATPEIRSQIEQLLQEKMKEEIPKVRTESAAEYERSGSINETWAAWAERWKRFDQKLALGEGKLDYEIEAFQLSPDGVPRLFVRARWTIDQKPAFLMSLWLRAEPVLAVEAADARGASMLRTGEYIDSELDLNSQGTILNVFDRHRDGHGELLFYSPGYEGFDIRLYRYTGTGPAPTNISHGGGC